MCKCEIYLHKNLHGETCLEKIFIIPLLLTKKSEVLPCNHALCIYTVTTPYLRRISLTLSCPMDLKLYPLDRQQCELRIASCKFIYI